MCRCCSYSSWYSETGGGGARLCLLLQRKLAQMPFYDPRVKQQKGDSAECHAQSGQIMRSTCSFHEAGDLLSISPLNLLRLPEGDVSEGMRKLKEWRTEWVSGQQRRNPNSQSYLQSFTWLVNSQTTKKLLLSWRSLCSKMCWRNVLCIFDLINN